ncbi:MAG: sigma-70 family RNA polymerase sigma factor [Deltaproteobacteria bacterium]|nr:sigma-70 family RNA polymerase sigma factor [Deltaproteobacteria bacterium]
MVTTASGAARQSTPPPTPERDPERGGGAVRHLGFVGDDAALVEALRRGEPGAPAALYDRHALHLRRVLARVLGVDDELPDVLHETFAQALSSIDKLDDPQRLEGWLVRIAVFTARGVIRKRTRRRWLRFMAPEEVPDPGEAPADPRARLALARVRRALNKLSADERIAFTLRYFEQLELREVADAMDVSLSTVKRRLKAAEKRFVAAANDDPHLREWLERSPRWSAA